MIRSAAKERNRRKNNHFAQVKPGDIAQNLEEFPKISECSWQRNDKMPRPDLLKKLEEMKGERI